MSGSPTARPPLASHPDVRAVSEWLAARVREVDDSPFWREYNRNPDPAFRLRALATWLERRPGRPLPALRGGRSASPARLRVLVTIAYLRGRQTPAGVEPVSRPWTWTEIEDLAAEYAEEAGDVAEEWGEFESRAGKKFAKAEAAGLHVLYGCPDGFAASVTAVLAMAGVPLSTGSDRGPTTPGDGATMRL